MKRKERIEGSGIIVSGKLLLKPKKWGRGTQLKRIQGYIFWGISVQSESREEFEGGLEKGKEKGEKE